MRLFVTGHAGMLGTHVVEQLTAAGYTNILTQTRDELDLCSQAAVQEFFQEKTPTHVIHCAAKVGGIGANLNDPSSFLYMNAVMNANVIHAAYQSGVETFINIGSSCMYPREAIQPMKEECLLTGPFEPSNEGYALGKLIGLKLCEYYKKRGAAYSTFMLPNLYGKYETFDPTHSHVISALIMKFVEAKEHGLPSVTCWGTGTAEREFLYVQDAAQAIVQALKKNISSEMSYINIGTGMSVSIFDLAHMIAKRVGYEGDIRWDTTKPDGMPQKCMDVSRMRAAGFQLNTTLQEGLAKTLTWYYESRA